MSVRNIRNHQSRGLLPPPEVRARIGYYGPEHVARLRLIQEMQAEGFKLSAIERLIGEHGVDADRFVGLRQAVTAPFTTEAPEVLTREELAERFGTDDDKLLAKAQKLGLLVALGEERFEAPSPALLRAAEDVLRTRHPARRRPRRDREAQPQLQVLGPRLRQASSSRSSGSPSTKPAAPRSAGRRSPRRSSSCARSPLEALNATFRLTLTAEIEKAFGEVLERRKKS